MADPILTKLAELKREIGNPDLADALDVVQRIYATDDAGAHWQAAAALRERIRDIPLDYLPEAY